MTPEERLSKLTLKEKLAQLFQLQISYYKASEEDLTGPKNHLNVTEDDFLSCGSVYGTSGDDQVPDLQKRTLEAGKLPKLFMDNVVHGFRTIYPVTLGMGCTFDEALNEECAAMAARETTAAGVQVTFAPMVDLVRDARWGRVVESTGEDPYLNSRMGAAFTRGMQNNGVSVCVKHYACYGGAEAGRDYNAVELGIPTFRDVYLPAYKACIEAGADTVMTSFNSLNGVPATGNEFLLKKVLREELGFDGLLITDYAALREMIDHGYLADGDDMAEIAAKCEIDIEMMSVGYIQHAEKLIEEGRISMEVIDRMVLRILKLKEKYGLFDKPLGNYDKEKYHSLILSDEHRAICRRAAQESAVLLKNDGALPLNKKEKIALLGPFGNTGDIIGPWHLRGKAEDSVTLLQGLLAAGGKVEQMDVCGFGLFDTDQSNFKKALKLMKKSDKVVLAIGEKYTFSGEGRSRATLNLPPSHLALARLAKESGKKVVAVIFAGRPLELNELSELCDSVIYAWFPGTEGGNALADLLYGDVNFSGRLTMTFPRTVGQCPIYYNHLPTGRPKNGPDAVYCDDPLIPYMSMYIDTPNSGLYPFGYGLSYTDYELSAPVLSAGKKAEGEPLTVTGEIKNTGERDGVAVVQMYIHDVTASVSQPVKKLCGFTRVPLKAGEQKQVTFTLTDDLLRFTSADDQQVLEKGKFEVMLGLDSENTKKAEFELI